MDGSSICPIGFRVPTGDELLYETFGANLQYAFNSFLKIPSAGYHGNTLYGQGSSGAIWSNSVSDDDAFTLSLTIHSSDTIGWTQNYRDIGASVRCIRD